MQRILALIIALVMVVTALAACGNKNTEEPDNTTTDSEQIEAPEVNDSDEAEGDDTTDKAENEAQTEKLSAQKIGNITDGNYTMYNGGIIYRDDSGKYGIISYDKNDTGAKYTVCKPLGSNFIVSESAPSDTISVETLNIAGVVDANGNELIPMKYASADSLNDRFVRVVVATEQTDNKDEAILYYTDRMLSLSPDEGDLLFKGIWYVYDLETGKTVEGATGTNSHNVTAKGNIITYYDEANKQISINEKGENLPDDAKVLSNGSYCTASGSKGSVYSDEGKLLFNFDSEVYSTSDIKSVGSYYSCRDYSKNVTELLDETGKKITEVPGSISDIYGKVIHYYDNSMNKLMTINGTKIDGSFEFTKHEDNSFEYAHVFDKADSTLLLKSDGTVLLEVSKDDDSIIFSNANAYKKIDDKSMYYSLKDKDYTIEGSGITNWLVAVKNEDFTKSVVCTITGEEIISGYVSYTAKNVEGKGAYILAENEDETYDVYFVSK